MYQGCLQRFQSWLLSKTKELTDLMEKEDTPENKLKALQVRLTQSEFGSYSPVSNVHSLNCQYKIQIQLSSWSEVPLQ